MVSKFLYASCTEHPNCTMELGFAETGHPGFDMIVDRRPVTAQMQNIAVANFGEVYCVGVAHLAGKLHVERVDL